MVTVEYVVAGPALVLIGVAQIWLKRSNAIEAARLAAEARGDAAPAAALAAERDTGEGDVTAEGSPQTVAAEVSPAAQAPAEAPDARKPPLWDVWTGMLGYVAVALGIVVLVMGLLGK